MARMIVKRFSPADETRPFQAHGHVDLIHLEGGAVGRGVFEPGWRWSHDVRPIAGTKSCEVSHSAYVLSGRMHVVMDDGQETDVGPGDYVVIPPGHDAWTLGNEPCVMLDVGGIENYARASRDAAAATGAVPPAAH